MFLFFDLFRDLIRHTHGSVSIFGFVAVEGEKNICFNGDNIETKWRPNGDKMEIKWRQHGDKMGARLRQDGDKTGTNNETNIKTAC